MYFHLIWIKEKDWKQYELDLIITWWDENFIRDFFSHRGVVIVSITEFKEEPTSFWNIAMSVVYNNQQIQLWMQWDDLSERIYFIAFLWLAPQTANFVDNPIPESQMKDLIKSTFVKIKQENEQVKQKKEEEIIKENKKYEETALKDALKIVNNNIDRMEQIIKAWEGILSWEELKKLEDYSNDMKKIRLWTNFNKMASLVLDAHSLIKSAEEKIFSTYNSQKFLVDKNSSVTNIDVLTEQFGTNRISEKAIFQPAWLTTTETVLNMIWPSSVFLRLLKYDFATTFEKSSFDEFFGILMNLLEYMAVTATIVITLMWLVAPLLWYDKVSLYLLPAVWWLWMLLHLFNGLELEWIAKKIIGFIVLAFIYWRGLILLLSTFAL